MKTLTVTMEETRQTFLAASLATHTAVMFVLVPLDPYLDTNDPPFPSKPPKCPTIYPNTVPKTTPNPLHSPFGSLPWPNGINPHSCLVIRMSLSIMAKKDDSVQEQRDNLFHTRGIPKDMTISIIVDNGSCANVVSSFLVHTLALPTFPHPHSYVLNWFHEGSSVKVTR